MQKNNLLFYTTINYIVNKKFVVSLKICYNDFTNYFLNRISNSYVLFWQTEFECDFFISLLQIEGTEEYLNIEGSLVKGINR